MKENLELAITAIREMRAGIRSGGMITDDQLKNVERLLLQIKDQTIDAVIEYPRRAINEAIFLGLE